MNQKPCYKMCFGVPNIFKTQHLLQMVRLQAHFLATKLCKLPEYTGPRPLQNVAVISTGMKSLFIDEGLPVIGFGAFRGCQSLTSILISASLKDTVEETFDCDAVENVTLFWKNGCDLIQMPFTP